MKKLLAVVMALVMAFAFCVPSFAETTGAAEGGFDLNTIMSTITEAISSIIGGFGSSDGSGSGLDIGTIIDSIGSIIGGIGGGGDTTSATGGDVQLDEITPEQAKNIVDAMLRSGATKADIKAAVDQMYMNSQISETSYDNLCAAIEAAEEVTTTPAISDADAASAAAKVIAALQKMGIPNDQLKSVADKLYEQGTIPQNVYDEIIKQLDAAEATTAASNEGGIGGFLSGIVDAITGLFNGGSGTGEGGGNGTTTNPDSYEGKEPTGDTAILSVAAVAAVAGVALVLTKKKQK